MTPNCLFWATGWVVVAHSDMGHKGQTGLGEGLKMSFLCEILPCPVTAGRAQQAPC